MATRLDRLIDRLERLTSDVNDLKRQLIPLLPLPPKTKPIVQRTTEGLDPILEELYFDTLRAGVQDLEDAPSNFRANVVIPAKKVRTKAQKRNDNMQSKAFKKANEKLRTKSGKLRKGITQSDVAKRAQKELKLMKRPSKGGRPAKKRSSPSGGTRSRSRSGGGRR